MPYPLPLTRTEAYLAYKAGVIQQPDLKPSLAKPRIGIDDWLAYWTSLKNDYPKNPDGTPKMLQEEEKYIAYLCGVTDTYPDKCLRRVGAYLRYLISARWGRPDHPLNREELYLSLIKTQFVPSGDPSSDIVIDGTAKAPFVDVKMYGDTYQQSYTGKNILSINYKASDQGITFTHNPDGTLTLRGTCTAPYSNISNRQPFSLPAGTYTLSTTTTHPKFGVRLRLYEEESGGAYIAEPEVPKNGSSRTFTLGSDIKSGYIWLSGTSEGLEIDETIGIQLEAGSEASSFEPYVGGQPSPNPDYPQAIQTVTGEQMVTVVGKNLLSVPDNTVTTGSLSCVTSEDNKFTVNGTVTASWGFAFINNRTEIEPIPAGSYTLSLSKALAYPVSFQLRATSSGTSLIGTRTINAGSTSATFTLSEDASIFTFWSTASQNTQINDTFTVQIERGSTATAYAPYSKHTYPIDLGSIELCKLGDSQDYIWEDDGEWKIRKAIATHLFDGSTNDGYNFNADQTNTLAVNLNPDKREQTAFKYDSTAIKACLTASFGFIWGISDVEHVYITGAVPVTGGYNGNIRLYILKSRLDGYSPSLTNAQKAQLVADWLASNPMKVYYIPKNRATTDTVITDQNLINQLNALKQGGAEEGTTYIKVSATDPNLPAKLYVEAPKYD